MRHAILMIAYHNFDYVVEQIKKYDDDFSIFIHWDKRSALTNEQKNLLRLYKTVKYVGEEYAVNWGSYGIVRATLLLCKKALQYNDCEYFHLISDADALVTDLNIFKDFYAQNKGRNFLQSSRLSISSKEADKIKYIHRLEKYNIRINASEREKYNKELSLQKKEAPKKELPNCDLYWGSAWWSLTYDCVKYIISKSDFIEKYYSDTLFPDEMFAQTVVMNSIFSTTVDNNNKRYISWGFRNGNNPAVLDRSDLPNILNNSYHFARKISPQISTELLEAIDTIIFQKYINVNFYNYDLPIIIRTIINNLKKSFKGIMFGNAGALIFLANCSYLKIATSLITNELLFHLQEMVTTELKRTNDPTYSTGKLGLVVALEYIRKFNSITKYDSETEDILEATNTTIINNIYNNVESLSENEIKIYNSYFYSLKLGNNLSILSSYTWEYLRKNSSLKKEPQEHLVHHLNNGLKGLSGIGLHMLSKKYDSTKVRWDFLLI